MRLRRCQFGHFIAILLTAGALAGCISNGSKTGWSLPSQGNSGVDFDRHAFQLEVRPAESSLATGKQLLLLATVYDDDNKPKPKKRVEWKIEGPGIILDIDEGGYMQGRGFKEDSKSAVSFTNTGDRLLPPGIDNPLKQSVRTGQTWVVISSAVEGQTVVHAYAPEIASSERNRVMVKANWVDAQWQFPETSSARAGSEFMLQTRIARRSDNQPAGNYRVRYVLLKDGPASSLTSAAQRDPVQEITVATDNEGLAKAIIREQQADFGVSKIGIEILRADSTQPGNFAVVARSQTKVEWQAPQVSVKVDAPKTAQLNQAFTITYAVASTGTLETLPMILKTSIPSGLELVSSTPKATADGNELLWSLPGLPGGKQHTVQAVYRPTQIGLTTANASVRTNDNLRADSGASVQVIEARLELGLTGPNTALVGENLPCQIVLKNTGSGTAINLRLTAQYDAGLELAGKGGPFDVAIDKLEAGQSQTITLPLIPKQAGRSTIKATVQAEGNLRTDSQPIAVEIRKPEMKVEAHGPARGYLNQDVTWTLRVFNPSDVPVGNVVVKAVLPPETVFRSATNEGRFQNGTVEWTLGTTLGKQWVDLQVTGQVTKLGKAVLTSRVVGDPLANRDGDFRPVSLVKPFTSETTEAVTEVLGVPALQLEVTESADPVQIGQTVTYTIRIKNAGTLPANQVEIAADLPPQMRPLRSFGASNGKIDGQRVLFPALDSVRPGQTSVFTIEAVAQSEGDGRFRAEVKTLSLGSPLRAEEPTRILPRNDQPRR